MPKFHKFLSQPHYFERKGFNHLRFQTQFLDIHLNKVGFILTKVRETFIACNWKYK